MPTSKNGFQILNLHLKKHAFKKKKTFFNVLLPKYYQIIMFLIFNCNNLQNEIMYNSK